MQGAEVSRWVAAIPFQKPVSSDPSDHFGSIVVREGSDPTGTSKVRITSPGRI